MGRVSGKSREICGLGRHPFSPAMSGHANAGAARAPHDIGRDAQVDRWESPMEYRYSAARGGGTFHFGAVLCRSRDERGAAKDGPIP